MKPRPPSLRQRRRYVLALLEPCWCCVEAKALHTAILDATTSLWGDAVAARMQPGVSFFEQGALIVRCRRNMEKDLVLALSTVTEAGGQAVALRPCSTSGTILALKRRIPSRPHDLQQEDLSWKGKEYTAYRYEQKVDLFEKGIKGQNLLFLTEHDIEEF
jgi:ribonuclease P/MRP protein subunit POP5